MRIWVKNYGDSCITREVVLPDRGLVLVTGPNGVGKTSILADAPLYALYGEWGRGDPIADGGEVGVEIADWIVSRERGKTGGSVCPKIRRCDEHEPGGQQIQCDTATKATQYMTEQLGDYELWADAAVTSTKTVSLFSEGPDQQRKATVERMLPSLQRFDPALKRCKALLIKATDARNRADWRGQKLDEELKALEGQLAQVEATGEAHDDVDALRTQAARLSKQREMLQKRARAVQREMATPQPPAGSAEDRARLQEVETHMRVLASRKAALSGSTCPTCAQPVSKSLVTSLARDHEAATERARVIEAQVKTQVEAARKVAEARTDELQAEGLAVNNRIDEIDAELTALNQRVARCEERTKLGQSAVQIAEKIAKVRGDLDLAQSELAARSRQCRMIEIAERGLGSRGVRARLLSRAFAAIAKLGQANLGRVWSDARVDIQCFTETAGGVQEKTTVLTAKPGGRIGPAARFSRGQLRRVDLALLLARRALIAGQAGGVLPFPYLIMDETLDGLDEEGLSGCAALLAEEAQKSLVVVISHDERVRAGIPFTDRIEL